MRLFHRTFAATQILLAGFVDGTGRYLTDAEWSGVWLSDRPLSSQEGAAGDRVLAVDIPDDVATEYEWVAEGLGYREFLIPAAIVNRYGSPRDVTTEAEEDTDRIFET